MCAVSALDKEGNLIDATQFKNSDRRNKGFKYVLHIYHTGAYIIALFKGP